jgi:hypothetical protein
MIFKFFVLNFSKGFFKLFELRGNANITNRTLHKKSTK